MLNINEIPTGGIAYNTRPTMLNNIEALVFKISVGNTYAFAAQSFRILTSDSPLLNNVKEGRKIIQSNPPLPKYSFIFDFKNHFFLWKTSVF